MIQCVEEKNQTIGFSWAPGYVGLAGYEKKDTTTKEAVTNKNVQTLGKAVPHTDMRRPIKEAIRRGWKDKWLCTVAVS